MNSNLFQAFTSVASYAPGIALYVALITLSLLYYRRCPIASSLALVAGVLLMLAVAVSLGFRFVAFQLSFNTRYIAYLSLASMFLRIAGESMLVAAVFAGRRPMVQVIVGPSTVEGQ